MIDQIQRWSSLAGLSAAIADAGPPFRVRLSLEDIRPPMVVEVVGPTGPDDPYRFNTGFDLPEGSTSGLPAGRVGEIVESAVLDRSALADARPRTDGSGVEMIAVIYPDGLTRHTFMTAIYECQKLRQIITRDVEAALVSESALASLLTLAETTEDLAATVEPAPDPGVGIPGEPPPGTSPEPLAPTPWGGGEPAATPLTTPLAPAPPPAPPVPSVPADPPFGAPPSERAPEPPAPPPAPTWDPPPLPSVPPPLPGVPPRPEGS
jgi:hypothetical protein